MSRLYFILTCLVIFTFSAIAAGKRISVEEYINTYKKIAIDEMKRSGIPASITLAQGMLESANGNSTLSVQAKNHFGIKCHKWQGKTFYQDDDAKDECFRKYGSPEESYRDHTDFLVNTSRYAFLFDYKSDDYKNWAKGLKKAGYATSRSYAEDLIRIIEENNLHKFDNGDYTQQPKIRASKSKSYKAEEFYVDIKRRKVYERNRIKYVLVEEGDNLSKLTKEMSMLSWELKKYNELTDTAQLVPGQVLYIQPKRWKAEVGNDFHIAASGETMHAISQLYGVKLNKLYRKNRMEQGIQPAEGQKIWLRSRKPKSEMTDL